MGGMGMIAVGALGAPFLGAIQDQNIDRGLQMTQPAIHAQIAGAQQTFPLIRGVGAGPTTIGPYQAIDRVKEAALPAADRATADAVIGEYKQRTLTQFAYLPMIMAVAYLLLFVYYRSQGGYKVEELGGGH